MLRKTWKLLVIVFLLLMKFVTIEFAKTHPEWIEKYYTRWLYGKLSGALTGIANIIPVSLGEVTIFLVGILVLWMLCRLILHLVRRKWKKGLQWVLNLVITAVVIVNYLDYSWLLNNYRLDIGRNLGLKVLITDEDTLANLYSELIDKANLYKELELEDQLDVKDVLRTAYLGYRTLHKEYEFISPNKVIVKGLMTSHFMSKSGYTGVYMFYVGEPNINIQPPLVTLPHTACHEIAHQKGFAFEEEANYIGFLACKLNPSALFQYSAYLEASVYVGNALYKQDANRYFELSEGYSVDVKEDLAKINEFWEAHKDEKMGEVVNRANDSYLKAYNQPEGIKSYGLFVDLLIADYLKDGEI